MNTFVIRDPFEQRPRVLPLHGRGNALSDGQTGPGRARTRRDGLVSLASQDDKKLKLKR